MKRSHAKRLLLIGLLIVTGLGLEIAGAFDVRQLLEIARGLTQHWWLALILILAQALLFTFALAGSLFLWIAAPLYPPLTATLILACGGTLGGIGAYYFSRYLTADWKRRIENSRSYRLLHRRDNFFTLFAMRVFPGFPHALVNYSAGILRARLDHFVVAAMLGISIKSFLYARVIHRTSSELSIEVLLDWRVLTPLVVLAALSLGGILIGSGGRGQ